MIFYLENSAKFHLYYGASDICFMLYEDAIETPHITQARWKSKLAFEDDHIQGIVEKLCDEDQDIRELGKKMLEQSLNVRIYGRVVGHYKGASL